MKSINDIEELEKRYSEYWDLERFHWRSLIIMLVIARPMLDFIKWVTEVFFPYLWFVPFFVIFVTFVVKMIIFHRRNKRDKFNAYYVSLARSRYPGIQEDNK